MPKIVCDEKIPFISGVFEPYADVVYKSGTAISASDVSSADALIIRTRTICNESLLKDSKLKIIASATIGFDHIDTHFCESMGIEWSNAPGCNSSSVAQYIGAVLLFLSESLKFDLSDIRLGIVGYGNVGKKVANIAYKLGVKEVIINDPPLNIGVNLDTLLKNSDIVTLHLPLYNDTFHLIDKSKLELLKGKILINTSRGSIVDNIALKQALKEKYLSAAVLDVWENEPNIDLELLDLLTIATPHIAGYSLDGKANATKMAVNSISKILNFPLSDWKPNLPYNPYFEYEDIKLAIQSSYNIIQDDNNLRDNPKNFEQIRNNYHIRRDIKI